jgi:GcrA cell cycle regulator
MSTSRAFWGRSRVDLLKRLWDEGKTASEIATAIGAGCTRNSVIGKAHRLGLPARESPIGKSPLYPFPGPAQ